MCLCETKDKNSKEEVEVNVTDAVFFCETVETITYRWVIFIYYNIMFIHTQNKLCLKG